MVHRKHVHLTRRERQIMDVLYTREEATVADIQANIPDSPSYSAVRALLKKLMDKGHIAYRQEGAKYVYTPVLPKSDAKRSAMRRLVDTFFAGSSASAVVNLLGSDGRTLSQSDIDAIEAELKRLKAK
ncbi:MAG: BlaI/MecI/CopY family transcriptional regulator [Gammaproteobacteria bacterium]|nr:BlaI/MecI/CopY family transcriptional regulator [Gammaproteobacteria bacterium]